MNFSPIDAWMSRAYHLSSHWRVDDTNTYAELVIKRDAYKWALRAWSDGRYKVCLTIIGAGSHTVHEGRASQPNIYKSMRAASEAVWKEGISVTATVTDYPADDSV